MEPLLLFPNPPPPDVVRALDLSGFAWSAVASATEAQGAPGGKGWGGAVIAADADPEGAFAVCRALRKQGTPVTPLMLLVSGGQLHELQLRDDLFDDFCITPFHPREFEARLKHAFWRAGHTDASEEILEHGPLMLNLETYQATIENERMELTHMEYELLKFLVSHPGKVFTRETLLSRVWGYDYYGGARTVDVHVRRLRSKLGEEHATLISTVRSVGYSFGASRS